jgi:hypothetical protein
MTKTKQLGLTSRLNLARPFLVFALVRALFVKELTRLLDEQASATDSDYAPHF